MTISLHIEDESALDDITSYEKWHRPERCSVKPSVRKGLCRSMRNTASTIANSYAGTKKRVAKTSYRFAA